jgi:hypothetical protein
MQKEAFSVCRLTMPKAIEAAREANLKAQTRKEERMAQIREKRRIADALYLVCGSTQPYSPSPEFIDARDEAEALLIELGHLPTQGTPLYTLMETRNRLLVEAEKLRAARHSQQLTSQE